MYSCLLESRDALREDEGTILRKGTTKKLHKNTIVPFLKNEKEEGLHSKLQHKYHHHSD